MPFSEAIEQLDGYLSDRIDNAAGNERQGLYMVGAESLADEIDTKFSSDEENESWSSMIASGAHPLAIMAIRTKIGWLAACRRDLREQFGCTPDCTTRGVADRARFATESSLTARRGIKAVKRAIDSEAG